MFFRRNHEVEPKPKHDLEHCLRERLEARLRYEKLTKELNEWRTQESTARTTLRQADDYGVEPDVVRQTKDELIQAQAQIIRILPQSREVYDCFLKWDNRVRGLGGPVERWSL